MRTKIIYIKGLLLSLLSSLLLTSCDVHEMPDLPEKTSHYFQLNFEADSWTILDSEYVTRSNKDKSELDIRYIARAYPVLENGKTAQEYIEHSIFTKSMSNDLGYKFMLDLPPGRFNIMVWTDFVEKGSKENYLYNADNFSDVYLHGKHQANTHHRVAFRGMQEVSIVVDIVETEPGTTLIDMLRPMAKFEFITSDFEDFMSKENSNVASRNGESAATINLDDYEIVFFYTGFMPNAFSLFTDKPVDSSTGIYFGSKLTQINESEASMGFDYIFVNGNESITTVTIGIYNTEGQLLSMTEPIEVPLKRSWHTIVKGKFLSQDSKGGVSINPEFDGDYTFIYK